MNKDICLPSRVRVTSPSETEAVTEPQDVFAVSRSLARRARVPVMLSILALALYLPGFWWGAPHATAPDRKHSWGVDDETPLGPLAEIGNIIKPSVERNLGYPLMYSFVVAGADAPYLGYLWLTGQLRGFSATYPFGLADPVRTLQVLAWIAHLVSVGMGAGIVVAAYEAGRVLWGRPTGVLAALFAATSFPMFYYTRTGNVDVPVLFFTALALAAFAHILKRGFTVRRAVGLGVCVGFALGTKETSSASFLALPAVILLLERGEDDRHRWRSRSFWRAPLVALCAAFLAFGLGSGLFVDPSRYFAHVEFARQRINDLATSNIAFLRGYPYTWTGHIQLTQLIGGYLIDAMTLPSLLLVLVGVIWAIRRDLRSSAFALPALTYLLVLFWSARVAELRYMMPVAFTLAFFAARAVTYAWSSGRTLIKFGFAVLAGVSLGIGVLHGADLTYAMLNDSRNAAAAWLDTRTQPGDRIEHFGPPESLPPLKSGVITADVIPFTGAIDQPLSDESVVREIVQGWNVRAPKYVLIIPDFTSRPGAPYNAYVPPEVYEGLLDGSLGYKLAAYFETPSLLPWVGRPALDYPSVNPPIRIFVRDAATGSAEGLRQARDFGI